MHSAPQWVCLLVFCKAHLQRLVSYSPLFSITEFEAHQSMAPEEKKTTKFYRLHQVVMRHRILIQWQQKYEYIIFFRLPFDIQSSQISE